MNKIHLIDASGYIYRAYHATPPLSNSKGVPTNAVLGFTRMMFKLLRDRQPTHIGLCFDLNSRAGRCAIDPNYKANRAVTTDDLSIQIDLIRNVADALNIQIIEHSGWEADDVIATVSNIALFNQFSVEIVTSDKDFIQLLRPGIDIYDPVKDRMIDAQYTIDRYGITPEQMIHYQSLIGDPTDNVPKVPNVGPKTAAKLIQKYNNINNIINMVDNIEPIKISQAIKDNISTIRMAYELVRFRDDLPINVDINSLSKKDIDDDKAISLFKELEFRQLLEEIWEIVPNRLMTQ